MLITVTQGPRSVPMSLVAIPQKYSPMYISSSPDRSSMQMAAARERLPHWVSYFPSELKTWMR